MLTKEQIEIIRWVVNVDDVHFSERAVAELRRLALLGLERDERMNEALSGEADAVRRAESAELGCEIAYRREPTQDEGDANEDENGDCFVAMGGWTGRRCRVCNMWTWGGPTACVACAAREERDERAERVGKLVLELWGTDPARYRWSADHRARLGRIDSTTDDPQAVLLLRGVADILETTNG